MTTDEILADLGAKQHGVVTTVEALSQGVSTDQLYTRVRQGRLQRVHRGVFAIAGSPDTWKRRIAAAVLGAGDGSVASHSSAAALLQLHDARFERVEVTVPRHRLPRLDRVRVHRSMSLRAVDRAVASSIPVTSAARTIVDLTAVRGIGWIARAMDDAMRRNLALLPDLRECSNRLRGAPGRRPSVVRMLVEERWIGGGLTESGFERVVLQLLLDAGVEEPVPQFWVAVEGHRYRLDLAWPAQRVALEADGFGPHSSYASFHDDRRRDLRLQRAGWTVLHVSEETPADEIVVSVLDALARSPG